MNDDYVNLLNKLKKEIKAAQYKTAYSVNKELITLYWTIGKELYERSSWGNKVLEKLSKDLKKEFPMLKGFSRSNLYYMYKFYKNNKDYEIIQTVSGQLSWSHNLELLKIENINEKRWYEQQSIKNGWSFRVLQHQILFHAYEKSQNENKITNFEDVLEENQKRLALDIIKNEYVLDFLNINEIKSEKDLQTKLVDNLADFLLELGNGFAYVGKEFRLSINNNDFYIDLLFYHIVLKCYVVRT